MSSRIVFGVIADKDIFFLLSSGPHFFRHFIAMNDSVYDNTMALYISPITITERILEN